MDRTLRCPTCSRPFDRVSTDRTRFTLTLSELFLPYQMRWLNSFEARKYLGGIGEESFKRIIKSGKLTYVEIAAGRKRFHPKDLDEFMEKNRVKAKATKSSKASKAKAFNLDDFKL